MKDFIIMVLGLITGALALTSHLVTSFKHINKTNKCKSYEHISGIRTAMIDGNCYTFANNKFVKINFEELNNDNAR